VSDISETQERFPVTLVTGFLGSGKTTLLNYLLKQPELADTAVIINEFGDVGLDHLLVEAADENMMLLASGCICCTIQGDLAGTLQDLLNKRGKNGVPPFRKVVIETTGLADPVPILKTLLTHHIISNHFVLDGVVTVVDAVNGGEQLDTHLESVKQAAIADRIVLAKEDLVESAKLTDLKSRLTEINPGADQLTANNGVLNPSDLFGIGLESRGARGDDVEDWLRLGAFKDHHHHVHNSGHAHDSGHDHSSEDSVHTFAVHVDKPIHPMGLKLWVDAISTFLGPGLLRVKGILNVKGEPIVVHAVQQVFHEPQALTAWPDDDHRSKIVFITLGLDETEIRGSLNAFRYDPVVDKAPGEAIHPDNYAQFMNAMSHFKI
jgi:G3E family GTPase